MKTRRKRSANGGTFGIYETCEIWQYARAIPL
jgi:hypothetical protein